jgi:hypothetical protein
MNKIYAIDFDGVIHDYKNPIPGRRMGGVIAGTKEALETIRNNGDKIIIHTVRGGSPQHISDFMQYYELPFDSVTDIKPNADFYIDDKAVRFEGNWDETLKLLI